MAGRIKMSDKTKFIFHIGGKKLSDVAALAEGYEYRHIEISDYLRENLSQMQPMTNDQINNSNNVFLLSYEAMDQLNKLPLTELPNYQIFYEERSGINETEASLLDIKGAQKINLKDGGLEFCQFIAHNYAKPWGTSIDNSMVDINMDFDGSVTKKGSSMFTIDGKFGTDYIQIILWKNKFNASGSVSFYAEINHSESLSCFWRIYYKNDRNDNHINYKDVSSDQLKDGQAQLELGQSDFPVNFALFVKGEGRVDVGDIHIRYALPGKNFLAMGGRRLTQKSGMGEELGYYFNAGDLRPPLNVYFSGFRPSEGFEGRWMMGSLGSPFILVYDPRLVGGSFYRGEGLENQIIEVIQDKLQQLGFSQHELILSGLSMGTYASFYYGAYLEPHAIIVGKPLANIGGLAINSRIFSPYDWDLAMDTIIHLKNKLTKSVATELDEEFWQVFEQADFSNTTFIIAHMLQDTDQPFNRIFNHLKKFYPTSKVLHKGLLGRHNDDTPGVTSWFYKQYQQLLHSDFNRKIAGKEYDEIKNSSGEENE
ncbi:accessory Sec system protein Asp2 [Leuconostoc citreum]|uniref:accessory Sec system protein Asp2 n=1 Tax=Leuconostoc citreum TaxID=33964 RepID=UPI00209F6245|nr:accessory Sec system protein Asp2 [Leuconostoc citreum]MCP1275092.1 accessory Sec system protein Asp2 [Leuconostoc citreum]